MHHPTSYATGPVLLDSSGVPEEDVGVSVVESVEDPLVVSSPVSPLVSPVAPVLLLVDGSVDALTDVTGSVVSRSSPVEVPLDVSVAPPSSPQPSTVDNAHAITTLEVPTKDMSTGEVTTDAILINRD
jgi:hypothetical protein